MRKSPVPVRFQALLFGLLVFTLSVVAGAVLAQEGESPEPDFVDPAVPVFQIQPQGETEPAEPDLPDPIVIPPLDTAPTSSAALYPVIVRLKPGSGYRLETRLNTVASVQEQRLEIQMAQENMLTALRASGAVMTNVHQYQTIPYVALHVDAVGYAALVNDPRVEAVFEDQVRELTTFYSNPKVGAPAAWDLGFDGQGYAVAVIDTGVDADHPAFGGGSKIVGEACFGTTDAANSYVPACPGGVEEMIGPGAAEPVDPANCSICYHGTHVAGIAAGNGGTYPTPLTATFKGVAPGANLIAVNVFSIKTTQKRPGAFDSDVLAGLEYVYRLATDGPDGNPNTPDAIPIASVNMSLGGGKAFDVCDGASDPGYFAIAEQLASKGIATIAATGNNGYKDAVGYPSCYSNIIAVGATTVEASDPTGLKNDDNTVGYFSNSDDQVDLLAPGFWVTSVVPVGTGPGGSNYRTLNGTSMASPYAAGAWAVMRQRFPHATVSEILEHLSITGWPITDTGQSTAYGSSNGNGITRPLIQLQDAIYLAEPELLDPLSIAFSVQPTFRWKDMVLTDSYDFRVYDAETDNLLLAVSDFAFCNNGECAISAGAPLQNDRDYYWTVQGKNAAGVTSPPARADFTIKANSPSGNIITSTPDFVFRRSADANITHYELKVEALTPDGSLEQLMHQAWYDAETVCDLSACIINPGVELGIYAGDRQLQWYYRAYNAATSTAEAWMGPYSFTILAPVTPGYGLNDQLRFLVNELTDGTRTADWYRFLIYDPETGAVPGDVWMHVSQAESCVDQTCAFILPITLYNDDHLSLYVSAYTEKLKGYSTWSTGLDFTVWTPPPSVTSLQLVGIYNEVVEGLTTTSFTECPKNGSTPVCGVMRPYFEVAYDVGSYTGDWIQIIIYNWDQNSVPYEEWINLRGAYPADHVACGPSPVTSTFDTCRIQIPESAFLETGTYSWFVRSYGPGGFSEGGIAGFTAPGSASGGDPNQIGDFRVGLPGQPINELLASLTATPSALMGTTDTFGITGEVTFSWAHEPSALWYNLTVRDINGTVNATPLLDAWYAVGTDVTCDAVRCAVVTDYAFQNGSYNWAVRYWNGSVSPAGATAAFAVQLPPPVMPDLSTLSVFLDETISGNTSPRYEWPRVDNATWYTLYVQTQAGEPVHFADYRALDICDQTTCRAAPPHHLASGAHEWYLNARGPGGSASGGILNTGWIGPATFTMSSTATGTTLPLTPSNITLNASVPEFAWRPAANASWYRLEVINQLTSETVIDQWLFAPEYSCTAVIQNGLACVSAPGIAIANATHYVWYVTPYGPAGLGSRSIGAYFSVDAPLSDVVFLLAPDDQSLQPDAIGFEWTQGSADYYGLEIKKGNAVVFVQWYLAADVPCADGVCRVLLAKDAIPHGTYSWTVSTWLPSNGYTIRTSAARTFTKL